MTDPAPPKRRVAMVTYFFPPLGGGGVQRILKQATYLTRSGWLPVIFTPRNPVYEITDPKLVEAVPQDLEVRRSFLFEPSRIYRWLVRVTGYAGRRRLATRARPVNGGARPEGGTRTAKTPRPIPNRQRLGLWASVARIVFFPDEQLTWVPFAVRSIRTAARARRFDAVLSSSPPITAHLVAGLARSRDTPWIADFRDPWIGNAFASELPGLHRRIRIWLERWIVQRADMTLFATPSLRAAYALRYPELDSRFVTLTNGYDRRDLPGLDTTQSRHDTFLLVYAGSLYGDHELEVFLEGLRRLLDRRPELREVLRVEFLGWLSGHNQAIAEEAAESAGLSRIVTFRGFLPRDEAMSRVAAADAGLLILGGEPGKGLFVPGKLFDYIGLNLAVLAVVPEGDVEAILQGLDWGVVVRPEPDAIAQGIAEIMTVRPLRSVADPEGRYDRVSLAADLAALLECVAQKRGDNQIWESIGPMM